MGLEGEGSGGRGGGKWGERGREVGVGYPPVHPLFFDLNKNISIYLQYKTIHAFRDITTRTRRFPETIVYSKKWSRWFEPLHGISYINNSIQYRT